jgi:hypothetical protein
MRVPDFSSEKRLNAAIVYAFGLRVSGRALVRNPSPLVTE